MNTMKTKKEVSDKIREIKESNSHVLTGSVATIAINAPRALMQLSAETQLKTLHWLIGSEYKSKLKGVDK